MKYSEIHKEILCCFIFVHRCSRTLESSVSQSPSGLLILLAEASIVGPVTSDAGEPWSLIFRVYAGIKRHIKFHFTQQTSLSMTYLLWAQSSLTFPAYIWQNVEWPTESYHIYYCFYRGCLKTNNLPLINLSHDTVEPD